MIKAVKLADKNVVFGAKPEKKDNGEVEFCQTHYVQECSKNTRKQQMHFCSIL